MAARSEADCAACGWSLEAAGAPRSWVGIIFSMPGNLLVNKKRGICIAADDQAVELHFSATDTQVVPVVGLPAFDEVWSRPDLSPSARLQHGARQLQHAEVKAAWDPAVLVEVAGSWANISVGAMRQLADEALSMGWAEVFDWVGLTSTEKAWRRAHAAASAGDAAAVAARLAELPVTGYPERLRMCLPFLADIVADPDRWRQAITPGITAGLEGAPTLSPIAAGASRTALEALGRLLVERGHHQRGRYWEDAAGRLADGVPGAPPDQPHRAWSALAALLGEGDPVAGQAGATAVSQLSPPLLDDLIDAERLTADHELDAVAPEHRTYVQARLTPEVLSESQLVDLEHLGELARRHFVAGSIEALALLDAHPVVGHYQELAKVVLGETAETARLRRSTRRILAATVRARSDLSAGAIDSLPDMVLDDPSLWMLLGRFAQSGALTATEAQRAGDARYATWLDLNRMFGLVTEGADEAAVQLGTLLLDKIEQPRSRAETASLTAVALDRLDRTEEAWVLVEEAMALHSAEGLWVNAAILARRVRPETAVYYDAQLATFLGAAEARAAALRHAISSSERAGLGLWGPELVEAAKVVMADCDFDTYALVLAKARTAASALVLELPERGGRFEQPRWLYGKLAQTFASGDPAANDVIDAFNGVAEEHRSEPWFVEELQGQADGQISAMSGSTLCAYRIALVSVSFAGGMGRWLRPEQVYMLGSLGTARTECELTAKGRWLGDGSYEQWFFDPIDEFLTTAHTFAPDIAGRVRETFSLSLSRAMTRHLHATRAQSNVVWRNFRQVVQTTTRGSEKLVTELPQLRSDTLERIRLGERAVETLRRFESPTAEQERRITEIEELTDAYRRETIDSLQDL